MRRKIIAKDKGEMAEWSIAAVLKTVELRGSGGSNPSLSAENKKGVPKRSSFSFFPHLTVSTRTYILFAESIFL